MPYVLISFGCLVLAVAAFGEGFRRGVRKAEADSTTALVPPDLLAEAERRGWDQGQRDTRKDVLDLATPALAAFPTSLGGRAMYRSIGGTVPPLRRVRKAKPT